MSLAEPLDTDAIYYHDQTALLEVERALDNLRVGIGQATLLKLDIEEQE